MRRFLLGMFLWFGLFQADAHEVRPAYLGIQQLDSITYRITWKIPALGDMVPRISPVFPEAWEVRQLDVRQLNASVRRDFEFTSSEPINGQVLGVEGLSKTLIDVLINVELKNGEQYSRIITPDQPFYEIPRQSSAWETVRTYLVLGIDHILLGIDHLLFVLALIFVTRGKWKIIKTVTSFTIAHSITLSLAALGFVRIPIPPVEAVIALSIVFLATEIISHREGNDSLTYRNPWLVAFTFGLLHGFGFASALSETGLPQNAIPLALAFFNVGVEVGQVAFVLVILIVEWGVSALRVKIPPFLEKVPVYLIGGVSSYWLIDRVIGFW